LLTYANTRDLTNTDCDSNGYCNTDFNRNGDSYCDSNGYCDSHIHSHGDADADANPTTYSYPEIQPVTENPANSAATTVAGDD
jgi:hypothetical protein